MVICNMKSENIPMTLFCLQWSSLHLEWILYPYSFATLCIGYLENTGSELYRYPNVNIFQNKSKATFIHYIHIRKNTPYQKNLYVLGSYQVHSVIFNLEIYIFSLEPLRWVPQLFIWLPTWHLSTIPKAPQTQHGEGILSLPTQTWSSAIFLARHWPVVTGGRDLWHASLLHQHIAPTNP